MRTVAACATATHTFTVGQADMPSIPLRCILVRYGVEDAYDLAAHSGFTINSGSYRQLHDCRAIYACPCPKTRGGLFHGMAPLAGISRDCCRECIFSRVSLGGDSIVGLCHAMGLVRWNGRAHDSSCCNTPAVSCDPRSRGMCLSASELGSVVQAREASMGIRNLPFGTPQPTLETVARAQGLPSLRHRNSEADTAQREQSSADVGGRAKRRMAPLMGDRGSGTRGAWDLANFRALVWTSSHASVSGVGEGGGSCDLQAMGALVIPPISSLAGRVLATSLALQTVFWQNPSRFAPWGSAGVTGMLRPAPRSGPSRRA